MKDTDIITKLKDKTQAQPFGLRSKEEQEVQQKAGRENVLFFDGREWTTIGGGPGGFADMHTYILKPDYEPEPEYVDWKIEAVNDLLCVAERPIGKAISYKPLYCVPAMPNFVKFVEDCHGNICSLDCVANLIHGGHKVFARFRT